MKKVFQQSVCFITFILCVSFNSYGQIIFENNTYSQITAPSYVDLNSHVYQYNTLDLHFELIRVNGYWYQIFHAYSFKRLYYRTLMQHFTTDPPCVAEWIVPEDSNDFIEWDYTTDPAPSVPPTITRIITITGTTCESMDHENTPEATNGVEIRPTFVELARQLPEDIALIEPKQGMITYDLLHRVPKYYDGIGWKSLWPSNENYVINFGQKISFADDQYHLSANNHALHIGQGASTAMAIGESQISNSRPMILSGLSPKVQLTQGNYTATIYDNVIINNGGAINITLPNTTNLPYSQALNRTLRPQLTIVNQGNADITLSQNVIRSFTVSSSTVTPGESITVLFDGQNWRKIN